MSFVLDLIRSFMGITLSGGFLALCLYACHTGKFPEVRFTQHKIFEEIRGPVTVIEEPLETKPAETTPEEPKPVDALVGMIGNMQKLMTGSDKVG